MQISSSATKHQDQAGRKETRHAGSYGQSSLTALDGCCSLVGHSPLLGTTLIPPSAWPLRSFWLMTSTSLHSTRQVSY